MIEKIKGLTWILTLNCNYNCHFCHRYNNIQSLDLDMEKYNKILNFIGNICDKNLRLKITGGEATTSKFIFDVLKDVNYSYVNISTNMSFCMDKLKSFVRVKNLKLTPTFHAQYADMDIFLDKFFFATDNNMVNKLNITFEEIDYDYIKIKYLPIIEKIHKVYPNMLIYCLSNGNVDLGEDIYNMLGLVYNKVVEEDNKHIYNNERTISYRIHNTNCYKNMNVDCYKNFLTINYNGDVYPCSSFISQNIQKQYNISDKNSLKIHQILAKTKFVCNSNWCCQY